MSIDNLCQITLDRMSSFAAKDGKVTVRTTLGNVRKRVEDLKPGEVVAVRDQSYEVNSEELHKILLNGSRSYQEDVAEVFAENSQGAHIPKLRVLLLEGILGDEAELYREQILKETEDFTSTEHAEFAHTAHETGVSVVPETVENWTRGETYAPQNWDDFTRLARLNPEFQAIFDSKEEADTGTGFYFHYKRFIGTKHSARALVDGIGESRDGKSGSGDKRSNLKIDYSDARACILEELGDLLEKDILFLEVKKVNPIVSARDVKNKNKISHDPKVERGIIFGDADDLPAIPYQQIVDEYRILHEGIYGFVRGALKSIVKDIEFEDEVVNIFTQSVPFESFKEAFAIHSLEMLVSHYTRADLMDPTDLKFYEGWEAGSGNLPLPPAKAKEIFKYISQVFYEIIKKKFDEHLKDSGSEEYFMRASKEARERGELLPKAYHELNDVRVTYNLAEKKLDQEQNKKDRKRLRAKVKDLRRRVTILNSKLRRDYNIDFYKAMFLRFSLEDAGIKDVVYDGNMTPLQGPEYVERMNQVTQILQKTKSDYLAKGGELVTRDDAQKVLDKCNVPQLIEHYGKFAFV